ncbi:MAG TPA: hypothetical protein VKR43_09030 [Bryobacteraceae bacterium]|nr:hypothetical protein [Bryobacteraceae bacterium]
MSRKIPVHLFVISAGLAFAQLDSNSITVRASRSFTVQPDLAVFSAPISGTKSAVSTLTSLQSTVPKANSNLSVTFSIQGTQFSTQAQLE